jgi:hypothetical protein
MLHISVSSFCQARPSNALRHSSVCLLTLVFDKLIKISYDSLFLTVGDLLQFNIFIQLFLSTIHTRCCFFFSFFYALCVTKY